eukprot:TRINITY_DN21467_c0_g1_i3.p1 TRINITY_DN21467_c0_g1~~TRINITY_DN21467_c0_g1_i3.p1  ORF type:complete len:595 (+),score=105.43 TRINITY_DN21467_c0_g1_i3:58-1842(+)
MRLYDEGDWALSTLFQQEGSVIYKGCAWGLPCGLVAAVLHIVCFHLEMGPYGKTKELQWLQDDWSGVLSTYSVAVSFLLVFRTQTAYSRFWDAISCLQELRGTWVNVVSSCFAFCNQDDSKVHATETFKHQLVRLMSLLSCSALASVGDAQDQLQVLDMSGMEESALEWLALQPNQCEIVVQWIQRLIIDNYTKGILSAPAPSLSRVFQELGSGITNLNNARRIELVPFPFPYAQMISLILCLHVLFTVVASAFTFQSPVSAFCGCFMSSFVFWSVNYIAIEIERPYGEDANDLPLADLAAAINSALVNLLQAEAQHPPRYQLDCIEAAMAKMNGGRSGTESASWRLLSGGKGGSPQVSVMSAASVAPAKTGAAACEEESSTSTPKKASLTAEPKKASLRRALTISPAEKSSIAQRLLLASQSSALRVDPCSGLTEEDTGSAHLARLEGKEDLAEEQKDDADRQSRLRFDFDYPCTNQGKWPNTEGEPDKTVMIAASTQTMDMQVEPRRTVMIAAATQTLDMEAEPNSIEVPELLQSSFELQDVLEEMHYGPLDISLGWKKPAILEDVVIDPTSEPLQLNHTLRPPALLAGGLL